MNWYKRAQLQVVPFNLDQDENSDQDLGYDPYERAQQAEDVFRQVEINPSGQASHVAIENGQVVGAVYSKWTKEQGPEGEGNLWIYSFDVALKPEFQKAWGGMKLISEGLAHYEQERRQYEDMGDLTMIRLWVVNRDLIPVLERRYGLDVESDFGKGGAYLVRYN
jgi:hypothetical protein